MNILGIDPGLSGALALITPTSLDIFDIPSLKAKARGRQVNWPEVARWIDWKSLGSGFYEHAFIELVGAMPSQGTASMFKFGYTAGGLRGLCAAHFIPVTLVSSRRWKKDMAVPKEKDAARARACELFPNYSHLFTRVKDHNRAEAVLIGEWGRRSLAAMAA